VGQPLEVEFRSSGIYRSSHVPSERFERNDCGSIWSGCASEPRGELRAFELALEETKPWPAVQQAFQDAFALFRQHKHGEPPAKSKWIKPNQTSGSLRIKIMSQITIKKNQGGKLR